MKVLNEKQIQYGFDYFHKDEELPRSVIEVSEYNGDTSLTINCTQLGDMFTPQFDTAKKKKRVVSEWVDFLSENTTAFTELNFGTNLPQELFDAICRQENLRKLNIKWGRYSDISNISNLKQLAYLHIGGGAGVQSIESLSNLENLVALSIESFHKIDDYSLLSRLKNLESLSIEGDSLSPKYISINSLDFLRDMNQLRFFRLLSARLQSKDYSPVLALENIEHLTLRSGKEVKALYSEFIRLPKLKYGLLVEKPELYALS